MNRIDQGLVRITMNKASFLCTPRPYRALMPTRLWFTIAITIMKKRKTDAAVDAFVNGVVDPKRREDARTVIAIMRKVTASCHGRVGQMGRRPQRRLF
jgi:hypothetical protein